MYEILISQQSSQSIYQNYVELDSQSSLDCNLLITQDTFNPTISSPTSFTSSTFYNVFSPRYSPITKGTRILFPTSSTNIPTSDHQNNHILSRNIPKQLTNRQQTPRPQSVYKNHQTKHLLNRIRYLQGIIKEKDRRYKQQQSNKYNKMQSSQSTTSSTYKAISFLAQSQSSKKIFQLEQRIKELQKTNIQQKMQYQRKIQQMEEHMATHFVEIESEIMDQEWMKQRTRDLEDSIDQASLKKGVYLKFDHRI